MSTDTKQQNVHRHKTTKCDNVTQYVHVVDIINVTQDVHVFDIIDVTQDVHVFDIINVA